MISVSIEPEFEAWRLKARELLAVGVSPDQINWRDWSGGEEGLFSFEEEKKGVPDSGGGSQVKVKADFIHLARAVSCHSDPERWPVLYRLLWRMTLGGSSRLLEDPTDGDVIRCKEMAKSVRRDCHKMKALVRFRKVGKDERNAREKFIAWFEPEHFIEEFNASFFVERFAGMDWSIFTPRRSLHWDGKALLLGEGIEKEDVPSEDSSDDLWKTYYRKIFDAARLELKAMSGEKPKKYRKNLPETRPSRYLYPLQEKNLSDLAVREHSVSRYGGSSLKTLREKAGDCRVCPLWNRATRTVFGVGKSDADFMIVGEQPGDEEDVSGRPFVGPAGQLLKRALAAAGLDPEDLYLTNAVKHFKWKAAPRGKKRIYEKVTKGERLACRPGLLAELAEVKPRVVVTLGNSAAHSLVDGEFQVLRDRGEVKGDFPGSEKVRVLASIHPSYLLRMQGDAAKELGFMELVSDLKTAKNWLETANGED